MKQEKFMIFTNSLDVVYALLGVWIYWLIDSTAPNTFFSKALISRELYSSAPIFDAIAETKNWFRLTPSRSA